MALLFKPAENTSAFLKMGLLGFAGSGKTYTASATARDLVLHMKKLNITYANKPVMFLDTETGADWVRPMFEKAGIPFHVAKTRAFSDLLLAVKEAEANASALVIDSISHFWKELCDSYLAQKSARLSARAGGKTVRARLEFQDWGYLKGEWAKFTDLFVNSSLHIFLCGRAGFEYDYFENDDGKKELEKTGVKMKAEGEMGYEPSLLVLMERNQKIEGGTVAETWREGTVIKDRSTLLDGAVFRDPKFKDFLPHIERLNLGGAQLGVDTSRATQHTITDGVRDSGPVQRQIALGEIKDLLVLHVPGQTAAEKQRKVLLLKTHFKAGWEQIELVMPLTQLRAGYDSLHRELEGTPSRYATPEPEAVQINDSLPDHSAPPVAAIAEQPKASLYETCKADLANLNTVAEVMHWAFALGQRRDLSEADRQQLGHDMHARQAEITKAAAKDVASEADEPADGDGKAARTPRKRAERAEKQAALVDAGSDAEPVLNATAG